LRALLILFAVLNALLYSLLLPLWEGFDEPFHFGYVQQLATGGGFPDARRAVLSREVRQSVLLAPASDSVHANMPEVTTYSEYFSWPPARRAAVQQALRSIPHADRSQPSAAGNYEAQQAPLAYILLALPERLLAGLPLPSRVLILRLIAALAGSLLLFAATDSLCSQFALDAADRNAVLFCVLSSQMTWATLAHVSNDWLAVPLAVWTLVFMLRAASSPALADLVIASLLLSAGLLTKAYFLALIPILAAISAIRGRLRGCLTCTAVLTIGAGPWYLRNYLLYRTITGMQEARTGIGPAKVLTAAFRLHWLRVAATAVRAALWTANNTFRSFSVTTLNLLIAVCAAALLLWIFRRHSTAEWIVAAYCAAFTLAIAYATAVVYVRTADPASTPAAWYAQVLVAPTLVLILLGTTKHCRAGPALAMAILILFGYVFALTYVFKLIPLYAGYTGRATLSDISALYLTRFHILQGNLSSVTLGPAPLVLVLAFGGTLAALALEIRLVRDILASCRRS
jgi:hypothetical protein